MKKELSEAAALLIEKLRRRPRVKASDGEHCPHCGSDSGITVSNRAGGWWVTNRAWNGVVQETMLDQIWQRNSRTGVCQDCHRRVIAPPERA